MTDSINRKLHLVVRIFSIIIIFSVIICFLAFGYIFYWCPDPVSPPAAEIGTNPAFDAVLSKLSEQWFFLFRQGNRIILTDIYGKKIDIVLDIVEETANEDSEFLYDETISPDYTKLAVNYFNEWTTGEWRQPSGRVLIVDIVRGSTIYVPIELEGFEFDWSSPVYWLDDHMILLKMHRYLGSVGLEEVRFLQYDLEDNSYAQIIEFEPCTLTTVMDNHTHVLLVAKDCEPLNERSIWTIESNGMRLANAAELSEFQEFERNRYSTRDSYRHTSPSFPLIRFEYVAFGPEGFGRYWEDNWGRQNIYLGEDLVRISDSSAYYEPEWQTFLELFIWVEGENTFIMNDQGYYRHLYGGYYLGKVPVEIFHD